MRLPLVPSLGLSLAGARSLPGTRYCTWTDLAVAPPIYCVSTASSESQSSPPTAIKMNTSLYTTHTCQSELRLDKTGARRRYWQLTHAINTILS